MINGENGRLFKGELCASVLQELGPDEWEVECILEFARVSQLAPGPLELVWP